MLDIILWPFKQVYRFEKAIYNSITNPIIKMFKKNNSEFQKVERKELLMDYEQASTIRSTKKKRYNYVVKNDNGKIEKDYFDAYSKIDVHSYLISQGCIVYKIEEDKLSSALGLAEAKNRSKLRPKQLVFFLTQLSTYIKAGIPLVEAVRILSRQTKNKKEKKVFRKIVYELNSGVSFSESLKKQGDSFPKLLVNMLKAAEMTGHLSETLDDMAEYYTSIDATRKQLISAMTYPSAIFILAIAVLTFVMVFVVPEFVEMYGQTNTKLPGITEAIINISNFLSTQYIPLILVVVTVIVVTIVLYKSVAPARQAMQWFVMHLPVIKNIVIYNELVMFTKTFGSLLKHDVFITDSMEVLGKITNNEIYKGLIRNAVSNLGNGSGISLAFKDHWAFPQTAYEMLATGEKTGRMTEMMETVSKYYQEQQKNLVTQLKSLVEPILIIFLAGMVGTIVLSIVIPMFDIYNQVG